MDTKSLQKRRCCKPQMQSKDDAVFGFLLVVLYAENVFVDDVLSIHYGKMEATLPWYTTEQS